MSVGAWAGLALCGCILLWTWGLWRSEARAVARFRKGMLNRFRQPWE